MDIQSVLNLPNDDCPFLNHPNKVLFKEKIWGMNIWSVLNLPLTMRAKKQKRMFSVYRSMIIKLLIRMKSS